MHTHINLIGLGFAIETAAKVAKELFGSEDATMKPKNYTPINDAKIKYAKWSLLRVCLHNAVTCVLGLANDRFAAEKP